MWSFQACHKLRREGEMGETAHVFSARKQPATRQVLEAAADECYECCEYCVGRVRALAERSKQ